MPKRQNEGAKPLGAKALCWRCDPGGFKFKTTDELEDLGQVIGQGRAVAAIRFGLGMSQGGYNIYALGPEGSGRHTLVKRHLDEHAGTRPIPDDWCYVSNFRDRRSPLALRLKAGRGRELFADMNRFAQDLRDTLRSRFESEEYRTRRQVIEEEIKERQEQALSEVEEEAKAHGIALLHTPVGFAFAPMSDGKVISPEVFQHFPEAERERVEQQVKALQKRLMEVLQKAPAWVKEVRDRIRALNDETATYAVGHLIEDLRNRHCEDESVLRYLEEVRKDVIENVEAIVAAPEKAESNGVSAEHEDAHPVLRKYRVNLIVDNADAKCAPVIYEDEPTYDRLLGRIEHRAEMGALLTDFHLIRAGALHRANGGYLIVDVRKLLTRPFAYEGLKRALLAKEARVQSIAQVLGLLSTVTLEPEPIALEVKVVVVGDRMLYYLLSAYDPEFPRLFKVAADFEERIERSDANNLLYARLVATLARKEGLRPFDRGAVARAVEFSARQAGDSERLSTDLEGLADVLREADYWARQNGRKAVGAEDVERALEAHENRLDRVRDLIQEEIRRGTIAIDTADAKTGQINGLSVMQLGAFSFGRPSRITARIWLGKGDVVDIEREVELGGPIHSKGVLILSGYLSAHYASERPLSLSASLVFEQSYGGVEGDSASSAELYALLSAIAEVPIRQSLAVTGSVNQRGEVQAIGGVNEKIEGFYDLCQARGLAGGQGVLVPESNVKHLMLHQRVIEAVARKAFHIYPVGTIDQGIEILTGMPAGARGADGRFPEATFNRRVEERLIDLAKKRRAFARGQAQEG